MSKTTRVPLIAGNWKMNLDHLQAIANVQKLDWSLTGVGHNFAETEVAVFPPFTDLRSVQTLIAADKSQLVLGAQDTSAYDYGPYTGEISAAFLAKLDVKYVIVGHSERRSLHAETNEVVTAKALAAIKNGVIPIICVGETEEDLERFGPAAVAVEQLKVSLDSLDAEKEFVIAYEPVWAIGTGKAATALEASSVCAALRKTVRETLGDAAAEKVRILYGGSVTSANVASYITAGNIDGVLVGGASLKPDEFSRIAQYRKHVVA